MVIHAREGYPDEVCGLLAGKDNTVYEVFRMTNAERSPVSYFMDSAEQFRVMKVIREKSLKMVGIYHSHPWADAYPSSRDIALAFYEDVVYVIISLLHETPGIRAFSIVGGSVEEVGITESQ